MILWWFGSNLLDTRPDLTAVVTVAGHGSRVVGGSGSVASVLSIAGLGDQFGPTASYDMNISGGDGAEYRFGRTGRNIP